MFMLVTNNNRVRDYDTLRNRAASVGLGGAVDLFREPARLAFAGSGGFIYGYEINLRVYPAGGTGSLTLPSLLGRNVIDHWRITYDRSASELTARVVSYDRRWVLGDR